MRSEHYDIALLLDGCNEAQLTALLADLDLPRATSAEEQRIAQRFFQKVGGTVSMESDPNGIVVPFERADRPIRKQQWYSLAAVACLTLALVASAVYLLQIPRPQISESSLPDAGTTSTTSSISSTISTASSDIPTAVSSVPENTLPTGTLSDETSTTVHTTTATISKPTNLLSSTTTTTTTVPYTSTPPMTTVPTSSFTTTATPPFIFTTTPPFIFTTTPPFIVTSTTAIHSEWFETTTQIETVADTTETTTVAELVPFLPPIQPMTAMVVGNKSYSD